MTKGQTSETLLDKGEREMMCNRLKVFSGNAHPELAKEICKKLDIELGKIEIIKFSNENIKVRILENVRGADVFVVQPSCRPVNDGIMELLIMIDAIKHASAERITAVLPYYPYARSDKKDEPRISITARLIADLLYTAGASRVLTMNLHSAQTQGFFRMPADQLDARRIICDYFARKDLRNFVVVATDAGGAKWASRYAKLLKLPMAILDKRREGDDEKVVVENMIGDVDGKNVAIFDDEILTGGTLVEAAKTLEKFGAKDIYAACVHPVLEGPVIERLKNSPICELVVTNTVPLPDEKRFDRLRVLSVGPLFAEAIRRIHFGESVSAVFL